MTTVVITGSTQGIGRGLAAEFLQRGDNVVISGRNQQRLDETIQSMTQHEERVIGQSCDVADCAFAVRY